MTLRLVSMTAWTLAACACGAAGSLGPPVDAGPGAEVPASDFVLKATGPAGGPFFLDNDRVVLTNPDAAAIDYEVAAGADWVSWNGPTAGVLAANDQLPIRVSIPRSSAPTAEGDYSTELVLRERSGGRAVRRVRIDLDVTPATTGWTEVVPSEDSLEVFVSSSYGSDSNSGLTESAPKKTVAAGIQLLRSGYPDILRLLRGDTWDFTQGGIVWTKSGRSRDEPMVITYYGSSCARPRLTNCLFETRFEAEVSYFSIIGLHIERTTDIGALDGGIYYLSHGDGFLVEDCLVRRGLVNLNIQGRGGRLRDFSLRRSVIADACATSAHAEGMYMSNVDGAVIEENVFDHNGWNEEQPQMSPTIFNHNMYLDRGSTNVTVRGNVSARASSHGLQLRPGGTCTNNLMIDNAIGILFGQFQADYATQKASGRVEGNVIIGGRDIDASSPRGMGIWVEMADGVDVTRNIVCHQENGTQPVGILAGFEYENVRFEGNVVYDWTSPQGGGVALMFTGTPRGGVQVVRNDLQLPAAGLVLEHTAFETPTDWTFSQNRYFSGASPYWVHLNGAPETIQTWITAASESDATIVPATYPDSTRTLGTYWSSLGEAGGKTEALAAMRSQSRASWRPELMAVAVNRYVRDGYGMQEPE